MIHFFPPGIGVKSRPPVEHRSHHHDDDDLETVDPDYAEETTE